MRDTPIEHVLATFLIVSLPWGLLAALLLKFFSHTRPADPGWNCA